MASAPPARAEQTGLRGSTGREIGLTGGGPAHLPGATA